MNMDMELDLECRLCGSQFKESLRHMPHGVALKCPLCHCNNLHITGDSFTEARGGQDFMEQFDRLDLPEAKIKL